MVVVSVVQNKNIRQTAQEAIVELCRSINPSNVTISYYQGLAGILIMNFVPPSS